VSAGEHGPSFGTVFHPEPEPAANGDFRGQPAELRGLPRRRRPAMIALAIVLIGAGVLGSAALYSRENHKVPVLVVTAAVPAGSVLTAADVGTTTIAAGPDVQTIPAGQLPQVIGLVARAPLRPGTLLAASELTSSLPPGHGQVLVAVEVKQAVLPAYGLAAGDHVLVVPTPVVPGSTTSLAQVLLRPMPAIVQQVSPSPNQDGWAVVDLLVPSGSGVKLAQQSATGQIGLIVTSRGSG
jgi:SAF domain